MGRQADAVGLMFMRMSLAKQNEEREKRNATKLPVRRLSAEERERYAAELAARDAGRPPPKPKKLATARPWRE